MGAGSIFGHTIGNILAAIFIPFYFTYPSVNQLFHQAINLPTKTSSLQFLCFASQLIELCLDYLL